MVILTHFSQQLLELLDKKKTIENTNVPNN